MMKSDMDSRMQQSASLDKITSESKKPKILIVDDNRVMRVAVQKILGTEYQVIEAVDGEDGWSVLNRDSDIQIVLLDLEMPELDGCGLLQRLRSSNNSYFQTIPVIIVTGRSDEEKTKQKVLAFGANDFISKPFESIQLLARSKSFLKLNQTSQKLLRASQLLEVQTTIDPLTGLGSHQYYDKAATQTISKLKRRGGNCVMILMQIDDFKFLFMNHGKEAANIIVKEVAKVIRHNSRDEDRVSRVGLARFGLLLDSTDLTNAHKQAERIRHMSKKLVFKSEKNTPIKVSISIGLFVPKLTSKTKYSDIVRKTEYCLNSALLSGGDKSISKSDLPLCFSKNNLSLDDVLAMVQQGNSDKIDVSKDILLNYLDPLMKYLISDKNTLSSHVDSLVNHVSEMSISGE